MLKQMNNDEIRKKVISILQGIDNDSLTIGGKTGINDTSEFELDSLGILKLVVGLENEFNIIIEDEDFTSRTMGSVSKITSYIHSSLLNK